MPNISSNTIAINTILEMVNQLSVGGDASLPELTNPATAAEIGIGYEAIDAEGNVITGTAVLASSLTKAEEASY